MNQFDPSNLGISSSSLNLAVEVALGLLAVIWLVTVWWAYIDARRRIAQPLLIGCATSAALLPFIGWLVYRIVRPPESLDDVRERQLGMHAAEARLRPQDFDGCPRCGYEVEEDFLRCPNCTAQLKLRCPASPSSARSDLAGLPFLRSGPANEHAEPPPQPQTRGTPCPTKDAAGTALRERTEPMTVRAGPRLRAQTRAIAATK